MGKSAWTPDSHDARPTPLLIVDDSRDIADLAATVLRRAGYDCDVAGDVVQAKEMLAARTYAVVLTDLKMPGDSGLDLAEHVRDCYVGTAIVVVSGVDDPAVATFALAIGAVGYLLKPFQPNALIIEVAAALRHRHLELENARYQTELEDRVAERTAGLERLVTELVAAESTLRCAYEDAVVVLSRAAEYRDPYTGIHLQRMSTFSARLALAAGMDRFDAELLRLASPMHDIGKIAVPDHVLLSTGALTDEERAIMRRHPETGYNLLSASDSPLLRLGGVVALSHHERFDGTGYPYGLAGDAIPLEGRIVAIADVFDALTSARPYKEAFSVGQAYEMISEDSGRHFDPDLVGAFIDIRDEVEAIATGEADVIDVTDTSTVELAHRLIADAKAGNPGERPR